MSFDATKAQFFRFGSCSIERITLVDLDGHQSVKKFSESVRYLGFHLKDGVGIDLHHHIKERCSAQSKG